MFSCPLCSDYNSNLLPMYFYKLRCLCNLRGLVNLCFFIFYRDGKRILRLFLGPSYEIYLRSGRLLLISSGMEQGFICLEILLRQEMCNIFQNCHQAWYLKNPNFQNRRISFLDKLDLEYFFSLLQKLLFQWMKFFWILRIRFFCSLNLVLTNQLKHRIWRQVTKWLFLKVNQRDGLSSCRTFAKFVKLPHFYYYFYSKAQYACCREGRNFLGQT